MSDDSSPPSEFSPPRWDSRASQSTKGIGYHLVIEEGEVRRVRTRFYFGTDETTATITARAKDAEWEEIKRDWSARWRSFEYDELVKRDKVNLDIFWLPLPQHPSVSLVDTFLSVGATA